MPDTTRTDFDLIEPNLQTVTGHYAEFAYALGLAAQERGLEIGVCANPAADDLLQRFPGITPITDGTRMSAPLGEWRDLYHRVSLQAPSLVLTATSRHACFASIFSRLSRKPLHQLGFYLHWMEQAPRDRWLNQLACRAREQAFAITPTPEIAAFWKRAGWRNVQACPYPALGPPFRPEPQPFRHLLMAGAARVNKGLPAVVELAEKWALDPRRKLPLQIQITKKHVTKHGSREGEFVHRLQSSGYSELRCCSEPPPRETYFERFRGALVLAPYDRAQFKYSVSGVVLDALLSAAPVIATSGTWAAQQVERFGAGAVIDDASAAGLEGAIDRCHENWQAISARAAEAAHTLACEHHPRNLLSNIITALSRSDA